MRLIVGSGTPLCGSVNIQGAKNSALKLMAATLLAEGTHHLSNVPEIVDVEIMSELLRSMGSSVQWEGVNRLVITTPAMDGLLPRAPYELVDRMRASIVVLGPLVARAGVAQVSLPGGDDFGHRPIDIHLDALSLMGADFKVSHGYVTGRSERLVGAEIVLEFPSHTATDNVLMAASLASGETTITNAAKEPEVVDLAEMLKSMGARIDGAGTSTIRVVGTETLNCVSHEVIPDRVEAATFMCALAVTGGEIELLGARRDQMEMLMRKLERVGVDFVVSSSGILARSNGRPAASDIATLPYPGIATDYKPLLVAMLTVADGVSIVTENLFAGRFRYIDELRRMAANIQTEGHHVIVRGVGRLSGAQVKAPDIRAGAALVIAGLAAEGETIVSGVSHIDRGYERFEEKLTALGANVERIDS